MRLSFHKVLLGVALCGATINLLGWNDDSDEDRSLMLRRLAVECIHNVYATAESVQKIPPVPPSENQELPAYISLCQEWIRHDAYYNETHPYDDYRVVEAESVCADWSAPHYTIMDIHAALIVSNHMKRVKYRHNCDRTRVTDEADLGFDHTTIQQILNTPGLATNKEVYSAEEVKQQCRRCLLQHDPAIENVRVKSKAVHHCLAWPQDNTRAFATDANALPFTPSKAAGGVTAFSSMVGPFRNRMYLSALEWQNVTDKPTTEQATGLVIWLDPTSIGLEYATLASEIDPSVTSISILSGPTCATAIFPTGQVCHEYGKGLRDHLQTVFPSLTTNGWNGGPGVSFKITASTAAGFSRMVLAKHLLCPPRTASCYTPAMSKMMNYQSALLLEDPSWNKALDFFTMAGTHGVVTVKVLEESQIPPVYTTNRRRHLEDTPEQFSHVNAMVDDEGYPEEIEKVPIASDETIAQLSDQEILDDIAIALGRFLDNPNVHQGKLEIVPTMAMIQEAIANGVPLNVNDVVKELQYPEGDNGNGAGRSGLDTFRHGELASDADSGRVEPPWGVEFWETAATQRHDSLLRIQAEWQTAFYGHIQNDRAGDDPSTIYEIPCPEHTANGDGTVSYLDGTATTTTPTAIIIASKDGISIRDPETGETTAAGIESTPTGTAFVEGGGYKIKEDGDTANTARRLIIDKKASVLPFTEELERVCKEFHRRKLAAKHRQNVDAVVSSSTP